MLYKLVAPVIEFVPLKTLFIGFDALLIIVPFIANVSVAKEISPSQAINPAVALLLSITNKLVKFILRLFGTPCKPS